MSKEATAFQAVIASALAAMKDAGGITARAIPARYDGAGRLTPYRGSNVILLALAGKNFPSSVWGTANALRDATGHLVAKGQASIARVVFAGFKDAPTKGRDDLLAAPDKPVDPQDPDLPKGKIRVYRTIASFNASQLAGVDLGREQIAPERPPQRGVEEIMARALDERVRHPGPGEKALDARQAEGVMSLCRVMIDWWHGKESTLSAGWFESTSDFLTLAGVAQSCVDAVNLQPGFYAYGVPRFIDPAEMAGVCVDEAPAAVIAPSPSPAETSLPSAIGTTDVTQEHGAVLRQDEGEDLVEGVDQKIDLGW